MKKMRTAGLLAAGYVLGTRAGRQRYEKIRRAAIKAKNSTLVRNQAAKVKDAARERIGGRRDGEY